MARDSTAAEHSALLEHTVVAVESSPFDYTAAVARTVDVVQTVVAAVMV